MLFKPTYIFLILIALTLVNCKEQKAPNGNSVKHNWTFFTAQGEDWSLNISEKQIEFISTDSLFLAFSVPTPTVIRVADANIKTYKIDTAKHDLSINISSNECGDAKDAYQTSLAFSDKKVEPLMGYGHYKIDPDLQGKWILKSLGTKNVDINHFREQLPYFKIDISSKRFSGFAGCNQVNGTLFSEHQLLRFIEIAQTRMLCAPPNKENDILSALAKVTTYEIKNNTLVLSNPDEQLLVLTKT